ncbi:PilW family protein, partial [Klebsiella pneumoniae]|uniref:PilW family protein n=1 Tax=Klebsiella pneumoniae TaxID=573 RepID=UPI00226FC66D
AMSNPKRQAGVTLIELLVALGIGALLILGLVEVFSASRTAYQLSTGLARSQENGRFALDILQRDIRMAGHVGCVNDQARFLPENITPSRPL